MDTPDIPASTKCVLSLLDYRNAVEYVMEPDIYTGLTQIGYKALCCDYAGSVVTTPVNVVSMSRYCLPSTVHWKHHICTTVYTCI